MFEKILGPKHGDMSMFKDVNRWPNDHLRSSHLVAPKLCDMLGRFPDVSEPVSFHFGHITKNYIFEEKEQHFPDFNRRLHEHLRSSYWVVPKLFDMLGRFPEVSGLISCHFGHFPKNVIFDEKTSISRASVFSFRPGNGGNGNRFQI
jgi:hypothetical protein